MKRDQRILPGSPLIIADTNCSAGAYFQPDDKPHRSGVYGEKTALIESMSWQSLHAKNLLMACELILTTKDTFLSTNPYSWIPLEAVVAVGWLLKSFWNPRSPSFNPIELREKSQNHPLVAITMALGSGGDQQQEQSSESCGQEVSEALPQSTGFFTRFLYSESGENNRGPEQHQHTLGLNCFIHPCHGVCQFRPSGATPGQNSCPHLYNGYYFGCSSRYDPVNAACSQQESLLEILDDFAEIEHPFDPGQLLDPEAYDIDSNPTHCFNFINLTNAGAPYTTDTTRPLNHEVAMPSNLSVSADETTELSQSSQSQAHLTQTDTVKALSNHKIGYHCEQINCNVIVAGEDGKQQPCGKVFKNAKSLLTHKNAYHSGQKTCEWIVIGEDGQQRPCGMVCKNAQAVWNHKIGYHSEQQTCDVTVVGEDGQQRSCGKVCKNASALRGHKRRVHTGQQICRVIVVADDGQQRPCAKVYKCAKALADHKAKFHGKQKTCNLAIVGKDGQSRPCGKAFKNDQAMSSHKRKFHTGQKTCDVEVDGEGGKKQPCGRVCQNVGALTSHKRIAHTGEKTCHLSLVGKNGQLRPCGRVFKNDLSLSSHRSVIHSGQKTCDANLVREDGKNQPCGRVCQNARALSNHKRIAHTREQLCDMTVVGEDGQERRCRKICKNAKALVDHKRRHRKRMSVRVDQDNEPSPEEGKLKREKVK